MEIDRVAAGILAGGMHTRMGQDKLLLPYEGKKILEHIYEECREFPEILVSVADRKTYGQFPYRFVEDQVSGYGPLEGIRQLLSHTSRDYVCILAADMPKIHRAFLRAMAESLREEECLILKTADGIHPLCGIYARSVLPKLERLQKEGIRKPRMLYEQCRVRYISAEELGYPDSIVLNVNTPEEYERLVTEI